MAITIDVNKKRGRGRPRTGIGPVVGVRLHPALETALENWIAAQPDPKPSKPRAIRQLLIQALGEGARDPGVR